MRKVTTNDTSPFLPNRLFYYNLLPFCNEEPTFIETSVWEDLHRSDASNVLIDDSSRPTLSTLVTNSTALDSSNFWGTTGHQVFPTLVSFFVFNRVDVPVCLQKAKSLYHPSLKYPKLRLLTMLMRHGRKPFVEKSVSGALTNLTSLFDPQELDHSTNYIKVSTYSWIHEIYKVPQFPWLTLNKRSTTFWWLHSLLYTEIIRYLPVFSFYVQRVDKLKRRHSRGKSGKYTIIWKFVPQYKRFLTVLRWLVKDIRFQNSLFVQKCSLTC